MAIHAVFATALSVTVAHDVHNATKIKGERKTPASHHPGDPPQMSTFAKKSSAVAPTATTPKSTVTSRNHKSPILRTELGR